MCSRIDFLPLIIYVSCCLRDFLLPVGSAVPQPSSSGSLLYGTFWTVWERSVLLSQAVKQLTQFLVQAATEVIAFWLVPLLFLWDAVLADLSKITLYCSCLLKDYSQNSDKQKVHLADTLLDLLSVLVEFWCQQHCKLNRKLVEGGLKDLAEHFAIISQGMDQIRN